MLISRFIGRMITLNPILTLRSDPNDNLLTLADPGYDPNSYPLTLLTIRNLSEPTTLCTSVYVDDVMVFYKADAMITNS